MSIINLLNELRHEFKMEQYQFAEFLGINRQLYNRWEKQRGQPNLEYAMKIAKKTDKRVEDFIILLEENE